MNEIKSINTVYNNHVLLVHQAELDEKHQAILFHSGEKSEEWTVDIIYQENYNINCAISSATNSNYSKIEGEIIFTNISDQNEKVEFSFGGDSSITDNGSNDRIMLDVSLWNQNINIKYIDLEVVYDKAHNPIVSGIEIEANSNRISDNQHFVDYNHLQFSPSISMGVSNPNELKLLEDDIENCYTKITFTTDYFNNENLSPWHSI